MHNAVVLLVALPLLGSALCAAAKVFNNLVLSKSISLLTIAACAGVLWVLFPSVYAGESISLIVGGWPPVAGIGLRLDGAAWIGSALAVVIMGAGLLHAFAQRSFSPFFYSVALIMFAAMNGVLLTRDLFNMFVFLEILTISACILMAYTEEGHSIIAGFRYLLLSSVGMAFFLVGISIIYQSTGSLSLDAIIPRSAQSVNGVALAVAVVALICGIGVRVAFVPFHLWLPDAYAQAPHPVSAIFSGILVKISVIALWRVLQAYGFAALTSVFMWVGAVTAVVGVIGALAEVDVKKLLAYHSISQMGYIVGAIGVGTALSTNAALYHTINHALFKSLLFLTMGAVIQTTGERNLKNLGGLGKRMPVTFIFFLTGALSIVGVPPFNGFVSKRLLARSFGDFQVAYLLIWTAGIGTFASFIKLSTAFIGKPRSLPAEPAREQLPVFHSISMGILALGCVVTGIFPRFWHTLIHRLLAGPGVDLPWVPVYGTEVVMDTITAVALGLGIFLLTRSSPGQKLSTSIRNLHPSLDAALLLVTGGFVSLSLVTWLLLSP